MKPSKEFSTRYDAAKQWRASIRPRIEEAYRFCAPGRDKEFSQGLQRKTTGSEESTVFHSLGEESAFDLAGDLVTYFTPPEVRWYTSVVTSPIPEDFATEVKELVTEREDDVGDMIATSNYYDIAPQIMFEAASHGTPAMWVSHDHISQPIHVETVPPTELLITPGHLGILDRFREKQVLASTLNALFAVEIAMGTVDLSEQRLARKIEKPGTMCTVCWGFWVDWSDPGYPMWTMEVTIDGHRVTPAEPVVVGPLNGSCPLLVGRFNPRPGQPWGWGPALKAMPDMRVLDKIEEAVLLGLEDAISNTLIYPDDGFIDFSDGIVAGRAYPASRGFTRDQIYELNKTTNLEVGFFTKDDLERRIRASFYQDGPRQRGDTPPTAAQWFDEARRVQQRLGKPSAPLWTEMVAPFLQRVEYLGIRAGRLDERLVLDGKEISLQPVSPLQKAQNRDQVMIARSNVEFAQVSFGPEGAMNVIDGIGTFAKLVEQSGDTITQIRKEEPQREPANPPQ